MVVDNYSRLNILGYSLCCIHWNVGIYSSFIRYSMWSGRVSRSYRQKACLVVMMTEEHQEVVGGGQEILSRYSNICSPVYQQCTDQFQATTHSLTITDAATCWDHHDTCLSIMLNDRSIGCSVSSGNYGPCSRFDTLWKFLIIPCLF